MDRARRKGGNQKAEKSKHALLDAPDAEARADRQRGLRGSSPSGLRSPDRHRDVRGVDELNHNGNGSKAGNRGAQLHGLPCHVDALPVFAQVLRFFRIGAVLRADRPMRVVVIVVVVMLRVAEGPARRMTVAGGVPFGDGASV